MKKTVTIFITLALLLASGCSRESSEVSAPVSVSFDVELSELTKAASDGDGRGAFVNRCVLQIWKGDEIFNTYVRVAPSGTKNFVFKGIELQPDDTYDFLFWADCGAAEGKDLYYSTESLKNVSLLQPGKGNVDALDAFCNRLLGIKMHDDYAQYIVLKRPLAQMNLITEDLPLLAGGVTSFDDLKPVEVSYEFRGCTSFNVYSNAAGDARQIKVIDMPVYGQTKVGENPSESCTLAMAYLFPEDGESVSPVTMKVVSANGASVVSTYTNIPLKRNFRTNVRGRLLTVEGDFSVTVDSFFDVQ